MPGPMSTPKGWTGTTKRNKSGSHGMSKSGPRKSGKTAYDKASGKWQQHLVNKSLNRLESGCRPASYYRG